MMYDLENISRRRISITSPKNFNDPLDSYFLNLNNSVLSETLAKIIPKDKLGEEITFTPKLLQKEIPNDAEHIEAELILQIIKYNTKVGGTTQENYISKFENSIKITYDKTAKKWLCPAVNKKEILPGVKMSYQAFELKRGKLKKFKILFESTGAEGDIEAAYMISWN